MLSELLIYFREESIEFWSKDSNYRLIEVKFSQSNYVPLYFFLDSDELSMGEYAKMQFENKVCGAFGEYWNNALIEDCLIERFNTKYHFRDTLFFSLKEIVLKEIVRNYFANQTFDDFLKDGKVLLLFDSFLNEEVRNMVIKGFIEIIGFDTSRIINIEYWEAFSDFYIKKGLLTNQEGFIEVSKAFNDLYFNLISKVPSTLLNRKTIKGRGNDPLLDTILEFLSFKAISRGSFLTVEQAKNELFKDGIEILGLLKDGYIEHKIKLSDLSPFTLCFHSDALTSKLNNKASLNYIQNEFDVFRNQNQIGKFKIFLSGQTLNSPSFKDFFTSTYSNVIVQTEDFESGFLQKILKDYKNLRQIVDNQQSGDKINVSTISEKFSDILQKAEEEFLNENWGKSKELYQLVLEIQPCNLTAIKNSEICERNLLFGSIIKKADDLFAKQLYKEAQNEYRTCSTDGYCIMKVNQCATIIKNQREIKSILAESISLVANEKLQKLEERFLELIRLVQEIQLADSSNKQAEEYLNTYKTHIETVKKTIASKNVRRNLTQQGVKTIVDKPSIPTPENKTPIPRSEPTPNQTPLAETKSGSKKINIQSEGEKLFISGNFIEAKHRFETEQSTNTVIERIKQCTELRKYEQQIKGILAESLVLVQKKDKIKAKIRLKELDDIGIIYRRYGIEDPRITDLKSKLTSI